MKDDDEILLLWEFIEKLKIKITHFSQFTFEWSSEWQRLYDLFQALIIDIKYQMEKNHILSNRVIEIETVIEKYNSQIVGSESYFRQQLEILARSTLQNQSLIYTSYKKEIIETQNELHSLRMKIGNIEAMQFNKSAVHGKVFFQEISEEITREFSHFELIRARRKSGGFAIGSGFNASVDATNMNTSNNIVSSGQNRSTVIRNSPY